MQLAILQRGAVGDLTKGVQLEVLKRGAFRDVKGAIVGGIKLVLL